MNVPSGTLVYVFKSPLCFLNTAVFTETLELAAGIKTKGTGIERDGCIKQIIKKVCSIHYIFVCSSVNKLYLYGQI